ncbi:bifunctional 2-C-methyl-D-erythritol 4-phosphate cytidylyltransferase/2-C-methyl-D-erythritol 2,4-cyclodiphosphate synthase [Altericroceibacterium spongiae]|uniref:Bifunctional enzyme IspD/IspF n=1 Tax=Altericroceibacterium spongiae TaxID=2320269 RepID=A0A420ESF1_9SPHN|nr:bifunctional 2-C-methyl-D-erythritol 4-phosphate cytidylyltransferase/2-C-methyl-D-erythritol 2,4-cyclodiphosphate synthase [Altericroceibacterium spongiae]RKF23605.1 bifunctional 2-C-methyl-D-erythritol 4-phosphate cytidylyltransferase/2-C-methyl-D-erythritol 2,4-cyclodiphosphate synthase [Altericroceibacterium spongiae]
MAQEAPFSAIIVAAGKGLRAAQAVPKQFALWRGKPVLRHSAEKLALCGAWPIVVAVPSDYRDGAEKILAGISGISFVNGGESRQDSVRIALESMAELGSTPDRVLIHDAARPDLPRSVIDRLLTVLEKEAGAIPVLPVVDSLVIDKNGLMAGSARREDLRRVQTPQAFRFEDILAAHRSWQEDSMAGDDAQVLRAAGGAVGLVDGDERLHKLTFAKDFMDHMPAIRTGLGFDVHRLAVGEELWLCGLPIAHDRGLAGHSDADVGLHALVDALLGAVAAGDIGQHFPPSDPQWKGAPSSRFVEHAVSLVASAGYRVGNVDLTLMCEAPKIGPHREAMRRKLAELLGVDIAQVSVKATTTERLGFTGREEGIAAQAITTVIRNGE